MRALFLICAVAAVASADPRDDLAARFAKDPKARALALALFDADGDVADTGAEEQMDGGYRGAIHLVPQLPVADDRQHLVWVAAAARSFDDFFARAFDKPPSYRWTNLTFRFVRSTGGKRTPSAYASAWAITYNVAGSLLTSADGVRETLFHEIFHLNDEAHGDWSAKHLADDYAAILARCKATDAKCLAPFAPNTTMVRASGTYYAFQPGNGNSVHEYAAELAVRYWREQSEMLAHGKLAARAFKCGPSPNGRTWAALVGEFFGGRDLTPACPPH